MISNKWVGLRLLFLFFAIVPFLSCENKSSENGNATRKVLLQKAEKNLKKNPDSTLFYTQKILKNVPKNTLGEEEQITIYQFRQKAFATIENMDSVVAIGKKIRVLASKIPDPLAIANSLLAVRGDIDFSSQEEMTNYLPGAIATFKKNNMPFESARLSASYGTILCHKGNFVQAQSFLLDSYRVFNTLDSTKRIINVCMNIGSTYAYTKNTKKSLEYYKKAYDAALKIKDSSAITSVLMNIGTFYSDDLKDQDKALEYYQSALRYVSKKSNPFLKMKIDYNAAVAYFSKGDLLFSERTFQSMLADCNKNKAYEGVAMASKGLGDVYIKKQQPDKALLYLKQAIHLSDSLGMSYEALQMRPSLLTLYKNTKNYKDALLVSEQMKTINDSILSAEKQNAVNELEIKYQSEKKETEILNLKALSKSHQLMLFGLSFFVMVLFFVLRRQNRLYKEKQHSYAVLMQQYKEVRLDKLSEQIVTSAKEPNTAEEAALNNLDLYTQLIAYYEKEKPYLNAKLKATEIAKIFQVPQRTISATLKENGHNSFNHFNNKFRVADVKRQFEDASCSVLKMEIISSRAGFGNKQSFYSAFEEFTGLNPGFYRAEILK